MAYHMLNFAICDSSVALHAEVCNRLGLFSSPVIDVCMPLGFTLQKNLGKQPKRVSVFDELL